MGINGWFMTEGLQIADHISRIYLQTWMSARETMSAIAMVVVVMVAVVVAAVVGIVAVVMMVVGIVTKEALIGFPAAATPRHIVAVIPLAVSPAITRGGWGYRRVG